MSKARDYYWQESLVRTLQTMKDHTKNQKFSCVHKPLLEIPLENVVLDELHLMLRVTGMYTSTTRTNRFFQFLFFFVTYYRSV